MDQVADVETFIVVFPDGMVCPAIQGFFLTSMNSYSSMRDLSNVPFWQDDAFVSSNGKEAGWNAVGNTSGE